MNVAQLKNQLIGIPDDAVLVVPAPDHSYRQTSVELTKAITDGHYMDEDYETKLSKGQERIPVLVFR